MAKVKIDCECGYKGLVDADEWMMQMMHVWCPGCKEKLNIVPLDKM